MIDCEMIVDIATVSGSLQTMRSVNRQLSEYLPEGAKLVSYSFEGGIPSPIKARVLLLTGESFEKRVREIGAVWEGSSIVIAKRCVNVDSMDILMSIGREKTVLVVNDSQASAMDAIDDLKGIGFSNWNYVPYSPEHSMQDLSDAAIDCTISVGEPDLVPEGFGKVYEIGTRIISIETIAKVWSLLGWPLEAVESYLNKYVKHIISATQQVYESTMRVDEANHNLVSVLDSIDDGMMMYDRRTGLVVMSNKNLRRLLGIKEDFAGKHLSGVVKQPQVIEFLMSMAGQRDEMLAEWNGHKIMLTRFPVGNSREVCAFRSVDSIHTDSSKLARELIQQGFYSKYSFDDILGDSDAILDAKQKAYRLAKTDLNILIEGESGTGKELFAAAIHQASARRDRPYLAINFSSLNDSLMESELFGYEEGAFTGARRGGKAGVFEMANGGTIFLDEIGDISLKMQVGLLRVLQEKEVMRIGDGKIRYVDVRIVAATNQNLLEKVRQGLFREDLYYRLKIGYVYVPPLRDRKEDIPYLAEKLLAQNSNGTVTIAPRLMQWMEKQSWPGNVRELKNTLIYMEALRRGNVLDLEDVPEQNPYGKAEKVNSTNGKGHCIDNDDGLLLLIRELLEDNILLGRRLLLEEARKKGICKTEYQLRKRLGCLEAEGMIVMGKGKVGIQLT